MFKSLELFVGQTIELEIVTNNLVALNYTHRKKTTQEGEFSLRGGILDIFPAKFEGPVRVDFDDNLITRIASVNTGSGKSIWQHKIVIILPNKKNARDAFNADTPLNNFIDIEAGDYVVHNHHGIGKYLGIKELAIRDKTLKKHLVIEYRGGDKLFVPKHDMRLVQKYVSFNKRPPRIYKLGTKEWVKLRARIQKRLQQLAAQLLHTQALRASQCRSPCPAA